MVKGPSAEECVFEGVWTNWKKGSVFGSTLTLNAYNASLLSPALALLISIAGSQLWRLFQFAIHQCRATSAKKSFLYHQQQVTLRNANTDINTLWQLIKLAFAWRHQDTVQSYKNSVLLWLFTFLHLALIILAGLFASSLLNAGNEVLSRSQWCGWYDQDYYNTIFYSRDRSDKVIQQSIEFNNNVNSIFASVQQHVDASSDSFDWTSSLPINNLNFTSAISPGVCPFGGAVCHPEIDGPITLDTGYLSSSSHLGFNAPKKDEVFFRTFAQCAPLDDLRFVSDWQDIAATSENPAYQIADVNYGPSINSQRNVTYSVVKQYLDCQQRSVSPLYILNTLRAAPGGSIESSTADFNPIPELRVTDADLFLIMLSFNGAYLEPVTDPWFKSQTPHNDSNAFCAQWDKTLYMRDLPVTTIGCTQQWQVCSDPSREGPMCTPLLGLSQLQDLMTTSTNPHVKFNARQRATIERIILFAANGALFNQAIDKLSQTTAAPLQARHNVSNVVGLQLASTQWRIETQYWFSIMLAYLQEVSLQIGSGQFAASTDYINITQSSQTDQVQDAAYYLCQNQIIRTAKYTNFNYFALLLTIVLCSVIIILGLSIEDIIGLIRQRRQQFTEHNGKQDMWILNSDIEMLKTISELKTGTAWTRSPSGVPLAGPCVNARISELGSDTWTVEDGKGVVHKRTMTGLERHRVEDLRFIPNNYEQGSASASRSSYESNGKDGVAYEMSLPMTKLSSNRFVSEGNGLFSMRNTTPEYRDHSDIHYEDTQSVRHQDKQLYAKSKVGEQETARNYQTSGNERSNSQAEERYVPTPRFTPEFGFRAADEFQYNDTEAHSIPRTIPPSGWGVIPARFPNL